MTTPNSTYRSWAILTLVLSVAANLVLGFTLTNKDHYLSEATATRIAPLRDLLTRQRSSAPKTPLRRWEDVASPNFVTFAQNLRRIGCSEERIADLLVPEIQRQLRRKITAAFLKHAGIDFPWTPSPAWDEFAENLPGSDDTTLTEKEQNQLLFDYLKKTEDARNQMMQAIFGSSFNADSDDWKDWPKGIRVRAIPQ